MNQPREKWERERRAWSRAMQSVARGLDTDAQVRKGMGTVAWGRYDGEPSATDCKDNAVFGCGFLQGVRYALLQCARDNDWAGEAALSRIHDALDERP